MPIDPKFQKNRKNVGQEQNIAIWEPMDPPEKLGIRRTYVAVDWDLCTGCGICLKVCPQQVFEWVETAGHITSEKKAFPIMELECVQCYMCEAKCPVQAIRTVYRGANWLAERAGLAVLSFTCFAAHWRQSVWDLVWTFVRASGTFLYWMDCLDSWFSLPSLIVNDVS